MNFEDPDKLLRFKFGREEYCQRMLTSLILASRYPKWNSHSKPSDKGDSFLRRLFEESYDEPLIGSLDFIDEFNLPAIDSDSKDGAPDYAVLTPDRLWIVELKTEKASHRKDQMPYYQALARHHYPNMRLDMLYLTGQMPRQDASNYEGSRFVHQFWSETLHLIAESWSQSEFGEERLLETALQRELGSLDRPSKTFTTKASVIREAIALATCVQEGGKQRAVEVSASGLEDLIDLRSRIGEAITRDGATPNVRPWIWYEATSGGKALTELGKDVGCELRLSRYK
ncbi:MAG: hypothetical protein HKN13_13820 [Rhodothermales bacterium]|nr:hypothetical protein [Rhodothermales bacterium]